jgi:hypothetical protein
MTRDDPCAESAGSWIYRGVQGSLAWIPKSGNEEGAECDAEEIAEKVSDGSRSIASHDTATRPLRDRSHKDHDDPHASTLCQPVFRPVDPEPRAGGTYPHTRDPEKRHQRQGKGPEVVSPTHQISAAPPRLQRVLKLLVPAISIPRLTLDTSVLVRARGFLGAIPERRAYS